MTEHIINQERMNCFLNILSEQQDMKSTQKKEYIGVYGIAAEIFEESLIPFIPKILSQISKKLKEGQTIVYDAYAEALASVVHHVVNNLEDDEEIESLMDTIFTMIFSNMNHPSKVV